MKTLNLRTTELLTEAYRAFQKKGIYYIYRRTCNQELAEDLVQDAFVRLVECGDMLRTETIQSMFFTVLHNLLCDYLRRYYRHQETAAYLSEFAETHSNEVESKVIAADLSKLEHAKVRQLPPKQQQVYVLSRFAGKSAGDIADEMNLSIRTVENHLLASRKQVREYIRQCI